MKVRPPFSRLQPANIFIKSDHYKLGDFGLVTSVGSGGMGDCVVEGDSRYMSPELLQDGRKDLTKVLTYVSIFHRPRVRLAAAAAAATN